MTVTTVYPTLDGYIYSSSLAYATARAGGGTLSTNTTGAIYTVGQGYGYNIYESYLGFDTASIPDASVVTAITLRVSVDALYGSAYLTEARDYDYGTTVTNADWIPGANLANYTLVATGTLSAGNVTLTSETAFKTITNLKTGIVKINLSSIRTRQGIAPTGNEWVNLSNSSAYLTITYTPTITGTAAASLTLTATANGTVEHFGASTLVGELTASATGVVTRFGTAEVTASLTAGAAGIRETFGTSSFTSSISAEGGGAAEKFGTASFSSSLIATTSGVVEVLATADGSLGDLTSIANGTRTVVGNASFVSTESMSADGTVERMGTASLAGSMQASAIGLRTVNGTATFTAILTASIYVRIPMYVFTYTSSVAVGGTTHTTTIGDTTQGVSMGDNTDSAASLMIREAS